MRRELPALEGGRFHRLIHLFKQLLEPPSEKEQRREMGFHIKEEARKYRVRNGA